MLATENSTNESLTKAVSKHSPNSEVTQPCTDDLENSSNCDEANNLKLEMVDNGNIPKENEVSKSCLINVEDSSTANVHDDAKTLAEDVANVDRTGEMQLEENATECSVNVEDVSSNEEEQIANEDEVKKDETTACCSMIIEDFSNSCELVIREEPTENKNTNENEPVESDLENIEDLSTDDEIDRCEVKRNESSFSVNVDDLSTDDEITRDEDIEKDAVVNEAKVSLEEGKRLLDLKNYASAANLLLSACCKFCQIYGELGKECGEAYYWYGCVLLELVLTCSESEHVKENNKTSNGVQVKDNGNSERVGSNRSRSVRNRSGVKRKTLCEDETAELLGDISGCQLAWEMLELAKWIYIQQGDEEMLIMVYSKQVTVEIHLADYVGAMENAKNCLALQEKQSNPSKMQIAQTLSQLGAACCNLKEYYTAVKHYTSAAVIFDRCLRRLIHRSYNEDSNGCALDEIEDEIIEVKNLIESTKDKICEIEELIRQSMKSDKQISRADKESDESSERRSCGALPRSTNLETRANVILHLLRKRSKIVLNKGNKNKRPCLKSN